MITASISSIWREDGHGDSGHAGELSGTVGHLDVPDMGCAAQVDWTGDTCDPTVADASDVVRVDVEAHGAMASWRGERCAAGSERFRAQHRYATMKDADRLPSARVDGCPRANEVVPDFQKFNAEMRDRRVDVKLGERIDADRLLPDGSHGATYWMDR